MAEEIAFENGRIANFEELVTLTLDQVILHTIVHHSSTSTYLPNFTEIEKTFCGQMDERTYVCMYIQMDGHLRPALLGRLCQRVDLKITNLTLFILDSLTDFLVNEHHILYAPLTIHGIKCSIITCLYNNKSEW